MKYLTLFAMFSLGATTFAQSASSMNRPNILWIFSEDLSPYMGCYGDPTNTGHTPAIDKLASEGVLFTRAFATAPVCSASRSAIITGVMQTTTGTHHHRSSRANDGTIVPEAVQIHLPAGMVPIPELMRQAGYFTFNSGKDDYNFHYDRRALYSVGTKADYQPGMNGWQGNTATHMLSTTQDTWKARPDKNQPWFGQVQIMGGKAGDKHTRQGEKLAPNDVPLPPYFPDTPIQRKSWTTHYNAARGADAEIETILAQLKADGELDNTIIFFFSDHGDNLSIRHKQFCYEGGVQIPLMIKGPHPALKAGTIRRDLVSGVDISATTLALAQVPLPAYFDGHDLFAPHFQARTHVISARDRCDFTIDLIRTVRTDQFRYIRNFFPDRPLMQPQYRDKQPSVIDMHRLHTAGKLTPYQETHWFGLRPEEELYDLAADPHQINNLATNPGFAKQLIKHRGILTQWIKQTDDKGQSPESAIQLRGTYDLWKENPLFKDAKVNPEYNQFRP